MDWIINSLQMIIIQSTCLGLQQIGMILCAIAMAAYDQEKPELCKNLIKTKDGIASLALFHSLVGSQGELPQAFHRCAAVKGALYFMEMELRKLEDVGGRNARHQSSNQF
ncbi:rab escort protein 1-like isoform X2 [Papaver somniferum]|uniref:rab escort protein 1-like isoform X2 n=1 Tax=Papaver somniferum TaxID=3469 RepID=UPI000E702E39|nr:rab escort protein 1-like isoform X2 [Papaver somniferum]